MEKSTITPPPAPKGKTPVMDAPKIATPENKVEQPKESLKELPEIVKDIGADATAPISTIPPDSKAFLEFMGTTAPCDWGIEPLGGGKIAATHYTSRAVFTGTLEEFNKALRG